MGVAADCEIIGSGLLGQPVNALSSIAFVVAGIVVLTRRPALRWVGLGLVATGFGSFLFHGPMPPANEWAHDVSLAWLITIVGGLGTRWERLSRLPALLVLGSLFAVAPAAADPISVVLTVVAVISVLRADRSPAALAPLGLLGLAAIFGRLGSSGGPLCDPGSLFQPHAVWHLGAALAVSWWALVVDYSTASR